MISYPTAAHQGWVSGVRGGYISGVVGYRDWNIPGHSIYFGR